MRVRSLLVALTVGACVGGRTPAPTAGPAPVAAASSRSAAPTPAPTRFRLVEPPGGPGPGARLPVVAARVFALGDTQLRWPYGKRTFAQSPFADRWHGIEVAIRPAALDDGADLLLAEFLAERRTRWPRHTLVYMGDAADLACVQELDRFVEVMAGAGERRFLIVTSNHDGFYAGNFTQKSDADGKLRYTDMPEDWRRACAMPRQRGDHILTKGRAVGRLRAILPDAPAWATVASAEGADDPSGYRRAWLAAARPLGGGDPGAPPVWALLLDTVDYRDFDLRRANGAGTVGSIARAQLVALDRAIFEITVAAGAGLRPRFVAFGHHPLADLEPGARARLVRFLDERPEIIAYVAAHTHAPDERAHVLPSGRVLHEHVVGSTTDYAAPDAPQSARVLEVRVDPATGAAGVASWRLVLDVDALCADVRAIPVSDPLGYVSYRLERDDVPDVPTGTWSQLWAWLEDGDLRGHRIAQTAGALVVEARLLRALAGVYRDAPGGVPATLRARLDALVQRASPAPVDPATLDDYDRWLDPVLLPEVARLGRALPSFGGERAWLEALRATRRSDPARRRWFACHAARAAEAEARAPRRGAAIRIR